MTDREKQIALAPLNEILEDCQIGGGQVKINAKIYKLIMKAIETLEK